MPKMNYKRLKKVAEMQGSLYEEIVAKCYEAYQKELRKTNVWILMI